MKKFDKLKGITALLDRANVDTDQIIPKQFLKKIERTGFGIHLFHDWRFLDDEGKQENPDFSLNKPRYKGATILVARENFGCGSSREHAPWALEDYGFRVIISPSYSDIFFNNCFKNGMLPIVLDAGKVQEIFEYVANNEGAELNVDLPSQTITAGDKNYQFDVDPFKKECLLNGWDDIGLSLRHEDKISEFEKKFYLNHPFYALQ